MGLSIIVFRLDSPSSRWKGIGLTVDLGALDLLLEIASYQPLAKVKRKPQTRNILYLALKRLVLTRLLLRDSKSVNSR